MRASSLPLHLVLIGLAACAPRARVEHQATPRAETFDSARVLLRAIVARERLPGLAVTAMRGGDVVWHEGFGFADVERREPVTPATQFRIGSVSKLLTAVSLMRLASRGVVDLDAPIARYLGELPAPLRDVTLRQLAGHLAGVRHYAGNEFLSGGSCAALRDGLAVFARDTLRAPPGTRYSYSSYGYNLIGAVLEAASRRSFPEIVRREVLAPLAMTSTRPDSTRAQGSRRARTYAISANGLADAPADDLSCRWPSGGYLASTDDLARFGGVVLGTGHLDSASLATVTAPQRTTSGAATPVGIGWRVSVDARGRRYLHHGGTSNGGAAFLLVYPEQRLVVAMASNAFAPWGERDALAVAGVLLDALPR